MALNFPNNPALNDTFIVGGTTFKWNGYGWNSNIDRTLTIGRRGASALTINLTGSSFNVAGRSGNISINI